MPLHFKEGGEFLIRKELPKTPSELANVLDRQALFHYHGQKPFDDVTDQIKRKFINENPSEQNQQALFVDWLRANSRTIKTTENKIRYKKLARGKVYWRLLRNVVGSTPGLREQPFEIVITTDSLKPGDKIRPEETLLEHLMIQTLPIPSGDGWKYTVRYITNNKHAYFPTDYLTEGTRFVKAGSSNYSERSLDWGSVIWDQGNAVLYYEVPLFKTGLEVEITDDAIARGVFTVDPCDKKGDLIRELPRTAVTAAEIKVKATADFQMEQDLITGISSKRIPDTSTKLYRQIGAGIFNFLRDGHIYKFSPATASIKELTNFLDSVWHETPGTIIFDTGRPGLRLFDEWVRKEFKQYNVVLELEDYVKKSGNVMPGGSEGWHLMSPMFNAYDLKPWGTVLVRHNPALDNRYHRGPKHPVTGEPLLGYHFIAQRYRGSGIDSNISIVEKLNSKIWGYEAGAVGPAGAINDPSGIYRMAHSGRFCTLRHGNGYGLFIDDINDFVWFQPNIV